MAERQYRDGTVLAARQNRIVLDDVGARGQVRPVAVDGALRMARGSRRVDDRRGRVGRERPREALELVGLSGERLAASALHLGQRPHARMAVHEERAGVDHQDRADARALVEHLERLVEVLLVLGDDQGGAAVLEQMAHLARRARRIDAVGDRAERLRRQIGDGPLRARVADDGDGLARRDPILAREPARERGDTRGELAPRRLAPDAQLLRAKRDALGSRPGALGEQARQCARAQRLEIHAGRIIPEGIILGPS